MQIVTIYMHMCAAPLAVLCVRVRLCVWYMKCLVNSCARVLARALCSFPCLREWRRGGVVGTCSYGCVRQFEQHTKRQKQRECVIELTAHSGGWFPTHSIPFRDPPRCRPVAAAFVTS